MLLTYFLVYVQQLFLYLPGPPAYGGLGLNLLPHQSTTGTKNNHTDRLSGQSTKGNS